MNSHDMQHDTAAAQQIIKALALPALSRVSEPPRLMPLSRLPRLPRETSMLYTIGRVNHSGRVENDELQEAVAVTWEEDASLPTASSSSSRRCSPGSTTTRRSSDWPW